MTESGASPFQATRERLIPRPMTTPYLHDLAQYFCQVAHVYVGIPPAVAIPTRVQKVSDSL